RSAAVRRAATCRTGRRAPASEALRLGVVGLAGVAVARSGVRLLVAASRGELLKLAGESSVQGPTVAEPDHLAGDAGGADGVGEVEDGAVEGSFGAKGPLGEDWSGAHDLGLVDGHRYAVSE